MKPTWESDCGSVRLFLGDCLEVLSHLEKPVDLVVADPPYGVSQPGVVHDKSPGKGHRNFDFFPNDSAAESSSLACRAVALCEPLMAEHGSGYVWSGHRQFSDLTVDLENRNWTTRFLVWSKNCPCPPPPGSGWPSAAELCVYYFRKGRRWTHDGSNAPYSNVIHADGYRFGQPGKVDHPTQKPLACVMPLVRASSERGDTVLDFTMGSGTTGAAAVRLNRRFIGIEIEPRYFAIAQSRIAQELARRDNAYHLAPERFPLLKRLEDCT